MNPVLMVAYLLLGYALCLLGRQGLGVFLPDLDVDRELTAKDNPAFAVPLGAYYLGILLALGGPLAAPGTGRGVQDLVSAAAWGVLAVVMLNISLTAHRRLMLRGVDLRREIVDRRNLAAGVLLAGAVLANALLVLGALSGDGGLAPAAGFWVYAQLLLTGAAWAAPRLLRYNLPAEIRKGNTALALAAAGLWVGMGNILRMAVTGHFEGWSQGLAASTAYAAGGLAFLFLARELTDRLLLPGVTVRGEILEQSRPNAGVGYLLAAFYLGASILVGWCL